MDGMRAARRTAILCLLLSIPSARPFAGEWVESRGARVQVPDGWTANAELAAASGPINLTTFGGRYESGGILPEGGAEIDITSLPAPQSVADYIRAEIGGAPELQETQLGIRIDYAEQVAPQLSYRTVAVYVPRGSVLYKFYLTFESTNPAAEQLTAVLERVVGGAQLR